MLPILKRTLLFALLSIALFACKKEKHLQLASNKDLNFDKALSFFSIENDSAFFYFQKVATNSLDSFDIALAYTYMAVIQCDAGDFFGSTESSLMAIGFLDEKKGEHMDCLSANYNELGLCNLNLKNYDVALKYYNLALKTANKDVSKIIMLNNQALAYQKIGKFNKAIDIFSEIAFSKKTKENEYARVLSNLAKTKWLQNQRYNAAPEFIKALHIREKEQDNWGLNSSYAHLADYYTNSKPDSALLFAEKMYSTAKVLNSADDQIEALQKLIKLSPSHSTKSYFNTYHELSDSVQLARTAAKNQFALIRYETEKHKADNLKLQQDNTAKKYQIIKQRVGLFSILVLVIIAVIVGVFWYKKRKQRLELEAQSTINEHQLRTSKKIHDVVANGLYRVMTEIENQTDIDREGILDRLESMYNKSRDISYEVDTTNITQQSFNEKIANLLRSFATEFTKVIIAGNDAALWRMVPDTTKYELEHILQELMVNMKKHSNAANVVIRFEQGDNTINIYYADNGVGLLKEFRHNNGLTNIENRIRAIDGEIFFDTELEKGLKIQLSFPTASQ